jgi:3-hydroxyacyl-CoA dehydrogenase / enoyl-CoA hydratase / 3-hydroxybutyryl-CoA epimerase
MIDKEEGRFMQQQNISFEVKNDVAYVGFGYQSDKSMTVLDRSTLEELNALMDQITKDQKKYKGLVFHSHKERVFLAGADIQLIAGLSTEAEGEKGASHGQDIYNKIEDLSIPTVCCVHGVCLGGGLELALSCKQIITSDASSTQLGLPEVKLGILPGFGGTYRLPRKVGLPDALDMILSGKTLTGHKAKKIGLVAETYPVEHLLAQAVKHFTVVKKQEGFKETLGHLATETYLGKRLIFQKARESVMNKTKGHYQAPLRILELLEQNYGKERAIYLKAEAQAFAELCVSEQSKNLQHIFFLTEGSKKYNGPKVAEGKRIMHPKRGACLGAGTMGGGIAWLMARNKMAPIMKDLNAQGLELGLKQSSKNFQGELKRKKITRDEFERMQYSISPQFDYNGFKNVDLVIEAVVENMDVKKKVFQEVEKQVRPDTLLTSNTSSLSVTEMASVLEYPGRFAGLHFFNPVHLMPLVEIISHDKVDPETLKALYDWVIKVKKTPVIVKDGPGFLVNRILMPYLNEAAYLLEEGVDPLALEDAALNFGMPMGPSHLMDEVGIDVGVKVAKILHTGLGDRAKPSELSAKIVDLKCYGKKNGKGFFVYDEKGVKGDLNQDVLKLLPSKKKEMSEREIQLRLFLPMINEASYILQEGICHTPAEVDLALIYGIGFPPFRGGVLRYADNQGIDKIVEEIKRLASTISAERYALAPLLQKLVSDKKKFYEV